MIGQETELKSYVESSLVARPHSSAGRCCLVALTSGDVLKFQTFFWRYLLFPFQNSNGIIFSSVIS